MGYPRQEYWSGLPFSIPGDLPAPGIEPMSLASLALAGGFCATILPGKNYHCQVSLHILFLNIRFFFCAESWLQHMGPCCGTQASLVAAHKFLWLWHMGSVAPEHAGQTRDPTHTPCIGRRILNHPIREIPFCIISFDPPLYSKQGWIFSFDQRDFRDSERRGDLTGIRAQLLYVLTFSQPCFDDLDNEDFKSDLETGFLLWLKNHHWTPSTLDYSEALGPGRAPWSMPSSSKPCSYLCLEKVYVRHVSFKWAQAAVSSMRPKSTFCPTR